MRAAAFFTAGLAVFWVAGAARAADVSGCVGIDDATARLACYDAAAGRRAPSAEAAPVIAAAPAGAPASIPSPAAVPAAAAAGTVAAAATPAAAPALSAEQAFGLSAEKRAARDTVQIEQMNARVSAVANHPRPGRWVVTLDNGQVWEQREAGSESRRPRPGDEVSVRKAAMGSFLMVVPGRGTFRVSRIK